ncbi:MAG: aminoacyl-tRNA hydrolase [Nitrospirales bacterium]
MFFIVGLGNPGDQYSATRHNIGRRVVEQFGLKQKTKFSQGTQAYEGIGSIRHKHFRLVLPQTWMNQSGIVIDDLTRRSQMSPNELIVVYDDLDLDFGSLRIKTQGGSGGHNGIRSVLTYLETDQFCRLKVGIGHPPPVIDVADYVLSPFSSSESSLLDGIYSRAVNALESLILDGANVAMNQFNRQVKPESHA